MVLAGRNLHYTLSAELFEFKHDYLTTIPRAFSAPSGGRSIIGTQAAQKTAWSQTGLLDELEANLPTGKRRRTRLLERRTTSSPTANGLGLGSCNLMYLQPKPPSTQPGAPLPTSELGLTEPH